MIKREKFDKDLQELSLFAKAVSHPARLAILQYLAKCGTCISGDISDFIPLSRSTVYQHLNELKQMGFIVGEIEGLKTNYCINSAKIIEFKSKFNSFFDDIETPDLSCKC
ncbi:MAG: winged helix-turn-helix domain-containing protein [Bacteroidales bacterium]|nr:winged helix-turn-helix domain-containing protein [Bacteroidales bacterium]